ncbi:MAG: hypothetical protein QW620_03120 [Thermoplasmata archaeon]
MKTITIMNVLLWFVVGMLVVPALPGSMGSSIITPAGYGELKNMTFYFHNETVSQYVFDYSTTYIYNTILGSKQESIARWGSVVVDFYLYPQLADNITITGNVSVIFYMNMSATSNNFNGNFAVTLYDVSYIAADGTETSTQIGSAQVALVLTTNRAAYGVTITDINWTVEKGHSLRARISLSGGASNYYFLWFGTGNYDSRIIIQTCQSIRVEVITTYDAERHPTNWFSPLSNNTTIIVEANITDPYGGYDIYYVTITVKDAAGNVIPWLNNCTMERVSGNNKSFLSVYAYSFNYSSLSSGKYQIIVWALDLNGYYWYTHLQQFDYGPYPDTGVTYFFIGGFPVNVNFTCLDANSKPLKNATIVAIYTSKPVAQNQTDEQGNTTLFLFPSNYTILVYFESQLVATNSTEIPENFSGTIVIYCKVYRVDLKVLTGDGTPLENALVFLTKLNAEIIELKTDMAGMILNNPLLAQMPIGNYSVRIMWKGLEVGRTLLRIDHNSPPPYTLVAEVFNVKFIASDNHGIGLSQAQVIAMDDATGFVIDYGFTDPNGNVTLRLPLITAKIQVYWHGVLVYSDNHVVKDILTNVTALNCSVYYLSLFVCDANGKALSGAVCTLYTGDTIFGLNTTDIDGKCILRVPSGNYSLYVGYRGTEEFTPVEDHYKIELDIHEDRDYTVALLSIPPPFYATNLAAVVAIITVLLLVIILLSYMLLKERKKQKGTQDRSNTN